MTQNDMSLQAAGAPPRVNEWRRFRRVFLGRGVVVFGMIVIFLYILIAAFAPLIAPYPPSEPDLSVTLQGPSAAHWLGTDALGRDTFSRIIFGTRTALIIGLIVVSIACSVGLILGTLAGYYGGWTHFIIMRFIDAMMSFPMILLALVVAALLGAGMKNVIIALSVAMMPSYARLMCGQVLSVKENDYIGASRSIGASNFRIMLKHIVPNCFSSILVLITMMLGSVVLAEAALSFLGIGIMPPTPAWGSMINDAKQYLLKLPILSFSPGIALMLLVFAFNMVGDGLRDALDPRLRGSI
ncbi:MAG TPA: ABC transporter permease [Dehalococcoidales bacterium]|nr:ABC transporter permease [Dehalococcoidales bacterium]